jgi:SNF2 family DNA or RNA helicase
VDRPANADSFRKLEQSPIFNEGLEQGLELRPYQVDGLNWLIFNWMSHRNVILSDEMGLGKTAQTVSMIHHLHQQFNDRGPFLIVGPLSAVPHFAREFERFTNMQVVLYKDDNVSRQLQRLKEFHFHDENGEPVYKDKQGKPIFKFNVLITTYEILRSDLSELRQINWRLVCIDEAHCLSQWSYNFRPSFLRIKREIDFIRPGAVLALTATANSFIQKDIMHHLGIGDTTTVSDCVMSLPNRRINLKLVARIFDDNDDRFEAVLKLVKSALDSCDCPELVESPDSNSRGTRKRMTIDRSSRRRSILPLSIVYVWRRDQVDSMCEYLKSHGIAAVAYHAGMDSEQRERSQRMFDNGTARCVVATVAFGMGVDKADVRQVIHCYMVF